MATDATQFAQSDGVTLSLSEDERTHLLALLEQLLREKRVEEHRTESIEFRQHVQHEEDVLQGLVDKLRRA